MFLDTMDPEEYYAMALNGHRPAPIKVCFIFSSLTLSQSEQQKVYRDLAVLSAIGLMRATQ